MVQTRNIVIPVILLLLLMALGTLPAWAVKGPPGVKWTVHNMSASAPLSANTYAHSNESQVCIFCHTPHGADTSGYVALWNRENQLTTPTGYSHYTSAQQETAIDGTTTGRTTGPESMACLACHDGSVAMNRLLNYSNLTGGAPIGDMQADITIINLGFGVGFGTGAQIGDSMDYSSGNSNGGTTHLFDDHPISFDYNDTKNLTTRGTEFQDAGAAETAGVRFFERAGDPASKYLECSSCHDPHVNYYDVANGGNRDYTPFLIMPNTGSALCYACHIK